MAHGKKIVYYAFEPLPVGLQTLVVYPHDFNAFTGKK
jgi:hypothetical protein